VVCEPGKNADSRQTQLKAIINCPWAKLAGQDPQAESIRAAVVSDITYIQRQEGWLYLSGILDHCSRHCVARHADQSPESSLVATTWKKVCHNQPIEPGLLHHSDRGIQYASTQFQTLLRSCSAAASMSRKANPYDNAVMESFFATLKTESFQHQIPKSRREAKLILFDYIETFYNRSRFHSSLGYQSPQEFENNFNQPTN
jgi:putative transposase